MAKDFLPVAFHGSGYRELNAFDHVTHKATAIPVRLGWLDLTLRIGAAHLQS
jgi:hypothetical protein